MMRQFELVDKVSGYLSNLDETLLIRLMCLPLRNMVTRSARLVIPIFHTLSKWPVY